MREQICCFNISPFHLEIILVQIREDGVGPAISILTRVSGIGPAKAKELYDLGIRTIEELKLHENKLNHHQRIGLK